MSGVCRVLTVLVLVVTGMGSTAPTAQALTNAQIRRAQVRLNDLGCQAGPADGRLRPMTRAATTRFQAANRLAQTGRLNVRTRDRLLRSSAPRSCRRRPVAVGSGDGRRIVLSQRQNWVWLIGPRGRVVAQGGVIDNPSVLGTGTYHSGSKCGRAGRIRNNSDHSGRLRLHNFVRFAPCGIGFHQIPAYWSDGHALHANWLLGTNLKTSSGCIRVSRDMSYRIWTFTVRRTKVVVVRG